MNQKQLLGFLASWVVSTVFLLLTPQILRNNVVLGNDKMTVSVAAILSAFLLTAVCYFVPSLVAQSGFKVKSKNVWLIIFFGVNAVVIWVIKRFALVTGLGVANIFWVVVLAVIITIGQWLGGEIINYLPKGK